MTEVDTDPQRLNTEVTEVKCSYRGCTFLVRTTHPEQFPTPHADSMNPPPAPWCPNHDYEGRVQGWNDSRATR